MIRDELEQLAGEIRAFIVQSVSVTGGHLGSNLGVVELTLALHRVFESPKDLLLWDTGHQAYVHKILTGRRDRFSSLRQANGLSGYPSRTESPHDWVENSHASTILGYAHGLAMAMDLQHESDRRVVAVIGDGSMTGGMAYEALNNLGHSGRRVLIILNDNGRSYAPTVSRLAAGLTRLRLNPSYVKSRDRIQRMLRGVPGIGEHLELGLEGMRAASREVLGSGGFFEALGVRYIGPIDGHDIPLLEHTLRRAAELDEPILVHVLTQKGRGYKPAEDDDEKCLHDTPVFDPVTGPPPSMPAGYTQAFADAIVAAGGANPDIVAISAAMVGPVGLIPFQTRHPERLLDVGIAEQHAVTAAAGMAMAGLRPVVAIYSTFLTRAFDQVNLDVGLHRLPVIFAIDRAGITGDDGPSHHGILDMALLSKVPGMTVFAPSSAQEVEVMLTEALSITDGPCAIRYPKGPARQVPRRRGRLRPVGPAPAAGRRRLHPRRRQDGRGRRGGGPDPGAAGGVGHRLGRAGRQAARPRDDRRRRQPSPRDHRRGRGPGGRRRHRHRRCRGRSPPRAGRRRRSSCWACPTATSPRPRPPPSWPPWASTAPASPHRSSGPWKRPRPSPNATDAPVGRRRPARPARRVWRR